MLLAGEDAAGEPVEPVGEVGEPLEKVLVLEVHPLDRRLLALVGLGEIL